jgi:non-specific serine/threonine protein kinase
MVAGYLYMLDHLSGQSSNLWKSRLNQVLALSDREKAQTKAARYLLCFNLSKGYSTWSLAPMVLREKDLPAAFRAELESHSSDLASVIAHNPWLANQFKSPRKRLDVNRCINLEPSDVELANLILEHERLGRYSFNTNEPNLVGHYLVLLARSNAPLFRGNLHNDLTAKISVDSEEGHLELALERQSHGGLVVQTHVIQNGHKFLIGEEPAVKISQNPAWFLSGERLFRLSSNGSLEFESGLLSLPQVDIPATEVTQFLAEFLIPLAEHVPLKGSDFDWVHVAPEKVDKQLLLSEQDGLLTAKLRFSYEGHELFFDPDAPKFSYRRPDALAWTLCKIQRQPDVETKIYSETSSARYGLKYGQGQVEPGTFVLRARVDPLEFLLYKVPSLTEDGYEIFGEDTLTLARVNRGQPTVQLSISSGLDWFDVKTVVNFGDTDASLQEIRRSLRKKIRYVKLADGTIGELSEQWVRKYQHLFGLGQQVDDGVRFSSQQLSLVDQLVAIADQAHADGTFQAKTEKLHALEAIEPQQLPENFVGELRPYQKAGYDWLHFLHRNGFGGCLADDMGLGKTVQVLTFLAAIREADDQARFLIVVPRSLLVNWEREAAKFTPGLGVQRHFGAGRKKQQIHYPDSEIVLTTYGTMRQDIQELRKIKWTCLILDESQAIKNPTSQTAKCARLLSAKHRLVMTGTPVENNTFELWSQMTFINPGLLGSLDYFKKHFAGPIERDQDELAADQLRKMVFPFILRRTKAQVAPELPPRTERVMFTDMLPAQRRFYDRTRDAYRNALLGQIEEDGLQGSRMKILEGLLRLRQISNHPKLIDPDFRGSSAKLDSLITHLVAIEAGGHKVLVFSQFVSMLSLVCKELDARKLAYMYLDGQTRDRQEQVDTFQARDDIPFFLISLKAGGVGLNLTAADYVVHIDPWWNPAVEMQATDRSHRIGQDKPVFVYKLIARDSVEEKIMTLQERKRELVNMLISTEASFFKSVTADDVQALFS